ncbi:hypothetical protein A1O3_05053 [Capronia epimyces CBS 606.96]|uniref:Uncharacterized protein n=1 Tax=Capronia epimyces CBS 606.96 TaxID=1182542 RepID=W9Y5B6_9EURO|nr:uncharacterized protein A1O3_05053 [Capronia epimyces CBS 606.96]EXJ84386.1 hypothetical protein A1O3_05053 [Capronia epimyces CBS 606.96]
MAARSRILPEGRDHDKKDGFAPRRSNPRSFLTRSIPFRRRRVILVLVAVWLLYLFFKNMPTDLPPASQRYDRRYGRLHPGLPGPSAWQPEGQHVDADDPSQSYEGPIRFYGLPETLRGKMYAPGSKGHVLFAVSKLESIPRIIPIACSMAQHNRTRVHFAFMGRHSAEWEEIQKTNGISENECEINWHDARPDFSAQSSEKRLGVSAGASLGHIHSTLQLQAILAGNTDYEDEWLVEALRDKTNSLGLPLINLPAGGIGALSWISNLDASSLAHISKIHIDVVVQAEPETSASLIRLLRSIKNADYTGWTIPRITVELSADIDPFLIKYLSNFRWPADATGSESKLTIRHRVDASFLSSEQAALRTIESFYPLVAEESHVLLLSPRAELSPGYFQFLMYTILEYRYGASHTDLSERLVGISLDLPAYAPDMQTKAPWDPETLSEPLVLWQAPSSNAALYFGDRWVELHAFLSRRILADPRFTKKVTSTPRLAHEYPAWLYNVLEMMQSRNYYMMYPAFTLKEGFSPVTMHHELYRLPEEYMTDIREDDKTLKYQKPTGGPADDQPLTAADEIGRLMQKEQHVSTDSIVAPLLAATSVEQQRGDVVDESNIPVILFGGKRVDWAGSRAASWRFAEDFAQSVGGCAQYDATKKENGDVESLFCTEPGKAG